MEENILNPEPDFKLNKDRAVYLGAFLGGPLAAGYLIAENFKNLGQFDKVKNTWLIAIAVTILLIAAVLLVPGVKKLPSYIIPIIYALIAQALVRKYQMEDINAHIEKGGQLFSVWRGVLVGLIGAVVLLAIIVILFLITNPSLQL